MSRRTPALLVRDILERIDRIAGFVAGFDQAAFLRDPKTCDSVIRNLEVIGEAASRLPEDFRDRHPEIPWRRIVGLRNRIIHEDFEVDLDLVWEIIRAELPALKAQVAGILADSADGGA